jgi:aquaporin Z
VGESRIGERRRQEPGGEEAVSYTHLTLIHLVSIPVTNTSVNPARSTGPAIFAPDWAASQLWMFWLAPLVGAAFGALIHKWILRRE